MVLNHHEFHNGNGFPRGVRTKPMTDLVKIVALAVDTFETMKKAELNKKNTSLAIALKQVAELNLEVHKRRHQTNLVSKIMSHLGVSDKIEEA
jgi:HD-GYP domain-containing protein (c-di-GMP phosphodiesterase class II)